MMRIIEARKMSPLNTIINVKHKRYRDPKRYELITLMVELGAEYEKTLAKIDSIIENRSRNIELVADLPLVKAEIDAEI